MLVGDPITLVVEADPDGVNDLERVHAFRLEIAEADAMTSRQRRAISAAGTAYSLTPLGAAA
jgi:hypothetical protein